MVKLIISTPPPILHWTPTQPEKEAKTKATHLFPNNLWFNVTTNSYLQQVSRNPVEVAPEELASVVVAVDDLMD